MRSIVVALMLALAGAACTGPSQPAPPSPAPSGPSSPSTSHTPGLPPIVLPAVAGLTPEAGGLAVPDAYLDGMRLAVSEVNAAGGIEGHPLDLSIHDFKGDPEEATVVLAEVLDQDPVAIMYVGPGPALTPLRPRLAQSGTPVVLLEGDLYTSKALFQQVFQTTIPWEWQAHFIARYVVTDRKAGDVVFVGEGPEAPAARAALRSALEYWGGRLAAGFVYPPSDPEIGQAKGLERAARADWAVVFAETGEVLEMVNAIEEVATLQDVTDTRPAPGITGPASLLVPAPGLAPPEPGTTAASTYTWAGWADPVPRVRGFRERFGAMFGRDPMGLEQEGYDAVQVLARALRRAGGNGGDRLVDELEGITFATFSGFPIALGPDDHVLPPRDELGLFAVAGPGEEVDPWQHPGGEPWRALMRTFTYDGRRTNVLPRDRRIFFPFWNEMLPAPNYWRSRYGIVTRGDDGLH